MLLATVTRWLDRDNPASTATTLSHNHARAEAEALAARIEAQAREAGFPTRLVVEAVAGLAKRGNPLLPRITQRLAGQSQ